METIILFLKGIAVGVCNIIPGVSGGTAAVILNVFDDLIEAINNFYKDFFRYMKFLIPIGLGMLLGIFAFSRLISFCLETYSMPTNLFFTGLIVGSLPLIYKKATSKSPSVLHVIPFLLTLGIVVFFAFLKTPENSELMVEATLANMAWLFAGGVISAAAMVIPGISGSFVMILLGMYASVLAAVSSLNIPLLLPLGIGVIVGILSISKIIDVLLKKAFTVTYFSILGLMAGSVFSILYDPATYISGVSLIPVIASVITFGTGCFLALLLGKE